MWFLFSILNKSEMKKQILAAFTVLLAGLLACANPVSGITPANVETVVASTFAALTVPAPEISATPPAPTPSLLPHSMYFLGNDGAGLAQVYRLDKDGATVTQITFEPAKVDDYDVSVVDGSVAFVSNNQLLTVNADGSNRSMIVDGGPLDENNAFLTSIGSPVWSPNGQTIAFGYKGLNFYSIVSGQYNNVLADQINDMGNGFLIPQELYRPEEYSADGSKLVITLGYYEGASAAIYYPNGSALVRLNGDQNAFICCGNTQWTADGSALYSAYPFMGMFSPGLWRVDAATGAVTTLINADAGDGTFNFADAPYLAQDGQLYFFFANAANPDEFTSRPPLQLVRSAADDVTHRIVLRPETFELMNESLWAPDASFVIAAIAPIKDVYQGGAAKLFRTDGQTPAIQLVPFAMEIKWGP